MAETTDFVSTIRVKDLISAFESKRDLVRVEFTRPRAKSVGNILAKNVVVRQNEFKSLDDIEKALRKLEGNLNFYEVYNKEKHVAFQEQLFNILTSIINIEGNDDDGRARKKNLISKTQTLVSFLNQKLPSNANLLNSASKNQYKYTPYSAHVKENGTGDETRPSKQNYAIYSEKTKTIDVTDSSAEFFVSVKKLKETFQTKNDIVSGDPPKRERSIVEHTVTTSASTVTNGQYQDDPEEIPQEESPENVSVSKLRNLFEKKSEETSKGLGIITDEKPQDNQFVFNSANINIPYTERNLGNVRLQRSTSGNYMNYVGLLKRIDMSKSTSELHKEPTGFSEVANTKKGGLTDDSDAESEKSLENVERKSVQEIRKIYSNPNIDNSEFNKAKAVPDKESVSVLRTIEDIKVKYSTTITVNEPTPSRTKLIESNEGKSKTKGFQEHTFSTTVTVKEPQPSENKNIERKVLTETKSNLDISQEQKGSYSPVDPVNKTKSEYRNTEESEIKSNLQYFREENVNYFTAHSVNEAKVSENKDTGNDTPLSIQGFKEEEVNYLTAKSVDEVKKSNNEMIEENENKSLVEGFQEETVNYLIANSVDEVRQSSNTISEESGSKSNLDGFQEETVNYLTASSVNEVDRVENENPDKNKTKSILEGFQEEEVKYVTVNAVTDVQEQTTKNINNEDNTNIEDFQEVEVKYSTANSANESERTNNETNDTNENKSNVEGFQESEVKYTTAHSDDINKETEPQGVAIVQGTQQEEVIYKTAESKIVPAKDVAFLRGAQEEEEVRYSTATANDVEHTKEEDVAHIEGVGEEAVQYSTVESKSVSDALTINTGTVADESSNNQDVVDNASTCPTVGSEGLDREQALIDEEIDKISVEQDLANEEIIVNAEDLKNADNEFEKLLESSGAGKTVT